MFQVNLAMMKLMSVIGQFVFMQRTAPILKATTIVPVLWVLLAKSVTFLIVLIMYVRIMGAVLQMRHTGDVNAQSSMEVRKNFGQVFVII